MISLGGSSEQLHFASLARNGSKGEGSFARSLLRLSALFPLTMPPPPPSPKLAGFPGVASAHVELLAICTGGSKATNSSLGLCPRKGHEVVVYNYYVLVLNYVGWSGTIKEKRRIIIEVLANFLDN